MPHKRYIRPNARLPLFAPLLGTELGLCCGRALGGDREVSGHGISARSEVALGAFKDLPRYAKLRLKHRAEQNL